MSYRILSHRQFITSSLLGLFFAIGSLFTSSASANVQFPKCGPIAQWAATAYEYDKNVRAGFHQGKRLTSGLKDKLLKPTFGKTFDQWTQADIKKFGKIAKNCGLLANKTARKESQRRNYKAVKFFNAAYGYLFQILSVHTPANRADSYLPLMVHQQKVYAEHKKAQALKGSQLTKAKAMQPSKENIKELAVMAKNPQFAYLDPIEKKNHGIRLHNRGIELADKMVDEAASKFNSFPENLQGLRDIQAYRTQLQKDLKGLKSSKWKSFDTRYMSRTIAIAGKATDEAIAQLDQFPDGLEGLKQLLAYREEMRSSLGQTKSARWSDFDKAFAVAQNNSAETAVGDFEKELASLPATAMSLKQVQSSVGSLFKYRPAPANLQTYREVAKERSQIMQQEIRKIACYKELDSVNMDKEAREVAVLGGLGETSLGLFVCDMRKRGHKFQSYETPGFFGSTHTLNILNPRGITLSVEMEEVEAVKGKKMLVGTLIKDATSETKLTMTGWQDYALQLTGVKKQYRRY